MRGDARGARTPEQAGAFSGFVNAGAPQVLKVSGGGGNGGSMTSASTTDDANDPDAQKRLPAGSGPPVVALVEGASSAEPVLDGLADVLDTLATERDVLLRARSREHVELVGLLEQAIRWRDGRTGMCPVCGDGMLDAGWQLRSQEMVDDVRGAMEALADVERRLSAAVREARTLLGVSDGGLGPHELAHRLRRIHLSGAVQGAPAQRDAW